LNRVVRVPGALERVTIVPRARDVPDDAEQLQILARPEFDPRQEVLLAASPASGSVSGDPITGSGNGAGQVGVRSYGATRMEFEVQGAPSDSYLLLGEIDFPGWRAEVDGAERPILRADYALRAIPLAAGDRLVRLTYEPASLRLGALITVLAAAIGAVLWWQGDRLTSRWRAPRRAED
jgi:hypothetical protein